MIKVKRVYEPVEPSDGVRFLVDRLWPRGVKKEALRLDAWLKEVSPTTELRKWFGHEPAKRKVFQRRYFAELEARPDTWQPLLTAARKGPVTLLFSSRDTQQNNAVALKAFLEKHLEGTAPAKRRAAG
ncbi:MAG TPA: DUF488 domain-containing protein [Candidatus Acidoferrum sp.]|jgi:uncharacterized protein YeaO (DUF488 family)|nr:DUF488 domain-containing protein [Candidatus Acidoferrum sp.]